MAFVNDWNATLPANKIVTRCLQIWMLIIFAAFLFLALQFNTRAFSVHSSLFIEIHTRGMGIAQD
jgi:uncharacterized membrane protein